MVRRSRVAVGLALVALLVAAAPVAATGNRFVAVLAGDNEIPVNDSQGRGVATFKLNADGTALTYKLNVANIDGVTQSHIHCGTADVNGPVVAFLFGFNPTGVTVNGRLAEGTITNANVLPLLPGVHPNCPQGIADFDELVEAMQSGGAYVNVHTLQIPGGEIRGQLRCNIPGQAG